MIDRIKIFKLFLAGLVIQLVTSSCFEYLQQEVKQYMTTRDFICLIGQDIGEFLYCMGFWVLFDGMGKARAAVEFYMTLVVVDLAVIIFLNPYVSEPSKYWAFVYATGVLFFRWKTNKYGNKQTTN